MAALKSTICLVWLFVVSCSEAMFITSGIDLLSAKQTKVSIIVLSYVHIIIILEGLEFELIHHQIWKNDGFSSNDQ